MAGKETRKARHPTTRHGFIGGLSFSVVSLYGLWAAYEAAPTRLAFLSGAQGGGIKGMGHDTMMGKILVA